MKLKQTPEDFVVVERAEVPLGEGPYSIYRLRKQGIGTLETVQRVAREFGVDRDAIAFGGLKDKWATAEQVISIQGGPRRDLVSERFRLSFLGTGPEPVRRAHFEKNSFQITLRDLSRADLRHLERAVEEIRESGLPNYFDSQRFGSVKGARDFIGKRLVLGDFEGALKLALASISRDDPSPVKGTKKIILQYWGQWQECLGHLPRKSYPAPLIGFLARHPGKYLEAFERIDKNLRMLYVSAYQSALWNAVLDRLVLRYGLELFEKRYELGQLRFYRRFAPEAWARFRALRIPLPRKGALYEDGEIRAWIDEILREEGLELRQLKIPEARSTYFGRGDRAALVVPESLELGAAARDERNAGRWKSTLSFDLPKGSYATLLVKRIFH